MTRGRPVLLPSLNRARRKTHETTSKSAFLCPWKGDGIGHSGGHQCACRRKGNQEQSAWIHQGEIILDKSASLYHHTAGWVDDSRAVGVVYLDYSKAFETVP